MGYVILTVVYIISLVLLVRLFLPAMARRQAKAWQEELIRQHYEEVENVYRQMRGWKHDYRHHLQAIQGCIAEGGLPQLDGYLRELDASLDKIAVFVTTGKHMADAILNSKFSIAREEGISLDYKVYLTPAWKIGDVNLSILIGNLLDNAIGACRKVGDQKKRFIRFYMDEIQEQFYLSVSNSMEGRAVRTGGRFLSDRENHGYGLAQVEKVVRENQGWINCQSEDGVFAVEVMLPL